MSFWNELRRRNVFKVAGAYALLAWLIVQVASVVFPPLQLPEWTVTLVTVLLIIGFPLAIFLAWAYELTPSGVQPTQQAGANAPGYTGSGARMNYVLGGLLVLALGFIAVDKTLLSPAGSSREADGTIWLAVLPCDNLSPDRNGPDYAPGLHDELLNRLALIRNLHLTSRTSVLRYADPATRPSIPEIGSALRVDAIMECTVTQAGRNLRLTTQVIDVSKDTHLWSGSYPADISDLDAMFETEAQIAMDVANAVSVQFFETEIEQIKKTRTRSPEAFESYLAALGLGLLQPARQLALFDEALALDDEFVDAWVAKGVAHSFLAFISPGTQVAEELQRSREALDRARALAPMNVRVIAATAGLLGNTGHWIEAEEEFARAFELGLEPYAAQGYATLQMGVGHFERARDLWTEQLEHDPLDAQAASFLMMAYEKLGEDELMRQLDERGRTRYLQWPDPFETILIAMAEDDRATLRAPDAPGRAQLLEGLTEYLDDPAGGLVRLHELDADPNRPPPLNQFIRSALAAYFGDPEFSLELHREFRDQGMPGNLQRTWYPIFDSVRALPGFEQLLEELGLPEYWDRYGWPTQCTRFGDGSFDCA